MTIKTAVTLATGAAVGFLFGCFVSENTKIKIVSGIKDTIVYALTGEHIHKKGKPGPVTYRDYFYEKKEEPEEENDPILSEWDNVKAALFEFDTFSDAKDLLQHMVKHVDEYGYVSVLDVAYARNKCFITEYAWDKYGWRKEDIRKAYTKDTKLLISKPKIL